MRWLSWHSALTLLGFFLEEGTDPADNDKTQIVLLSKLYDSFVIREAGRAIDRLWQASLVGAGLCEISNTTGTNHIWSVEFASYNQPKRMETNWYKISNMYRNDPGIDRITLYLKVTWRLNCSWVEIICLFWYSDSNVSNFSLKRSISIILVNRRIHC